LKDDTGIAVTYGLPEVVYDPDSPYSLLGILFLSKFFAKHSGDKDIYDDSTWILTHANKSQFTWDHSKHECHFHHGESELPELWLYKGTSYF